MSMILNGAAESTPFPSVSYLENAKLKLDLACGRRRVGVPTGIVMHTTRGIPGGKDLRPQEIRPGFGPSTNAGEVAVAMWMDAAHTTNEDARNYAGAHVVIDFDGTVYCCADLVEIHAYHASACNAATIGIEVKQGAPWLYQSQIDRAVEVVNWITNRLSIQRQIPGPYPGHALQRLITGGRDFVGVWGHRDCSNNRGEGDPGNAIMDALALAGYQRFDVEARQDIAAWKLRQAALGIAADGIPGPMTVRSLRAKTGSGLYTVVAGTA